MYLLFKRNLLRKESICSYTPWKQHLIIYETTSFFSFFFFFFLDSKIFLWLSQKENNNSAQFLFWIHSDIIGPQCNVAGIYTNQDEII